MRTIQCQINMINNEEFQDVIGFEIPTVYEASGYDYTEDVSEILKNYSKELFKKYFGFEIWLVVDVIIEHIKTVSYFDGEEWDIKSNCNIVLGYVDGKPLNGLVEEKSSSIPIETVLKDISLNDGIISSGAEAYFELVYKNKEDK